MVTLDDVARMAGVSRMTASNALRGKDCVKASTAERVVAAARRLRYQPNLAARRLSSGKTNVIGFSTVELDYSPFSASLAAAVSDMAFQRGYQTLIQQTRRSPRYETSMLSELGTQFCEGMILSAPSLSERQITALYARYPLVLFDPSASIQSVDCVLSPSREGAKAAMGHLLDRGCRDILIAGAKPHDVAASAVSNNELLRLTGAQDALREHGLSLDERNIVDCAWNYESAESAFAALLKVRRDFDGVFCMTDVVAIGVMKALHDGGLRVPQDVKVIGFDGLRESRYMQPALSTVAVDPRATAERCLDLLLERMAEDAHDAPRRAKSCMMPFELVVGGSTG